MYFMLKCVSKSLIIMNIKQIKIEVVSRNFRSAGFKHMQSKAVIMYQFDGCFTTETHSQKNPILKLMLRN